LDLNLLAHKPFELDKEGIAWVRNTLHSMTLKQKVGQLFVPLCSDIGKENLKRLLHYSPGGIYRHADCSVEELRESTQYLQDQSTVPLLLSSNIEFSYSGIFHGGTMLSNQMGIAATDDLRMAGHMGTVAGREGKYCGINWSFSPVVDINYNFKNPIVNTRSFGSDPDRVLAMAKEYVSAMQKEGMAACAKHWPGDGVDDRDQHLVTSCNSMGMDSWRETYGRVYKELINKGLKTVMSAHITLPAYYREKDPHITPDRILPASISRELNIDLLRTELGFNGLIVSDATLMAGFSSQGRREIIIPMVIENGCDMFLFSFDDDIDMNFLIKGVESGRISGERLDEAVIRVLGLKASLGLHKKAKKTQYLIPESDKKWYIRSEKHVEWEKESAEKSITLVKDTQKLLPITPEEYPRIILFQYENSNIYGLMNPLRIGDLLKDKGFEVTKFQGDTIIDPDIFDLVIYLVDEQAFLCKGSLNIKWGEIHKNFLNSMLRYWHTIPTMFVSLGNPYHLYEIPRCRTYINTYSSIPPVQKALVELITGKIPFQGKSPVDPFCGLEDALL
jgi:beta-N-acetylhexosaminidase